MGLDQFKAPFFHSYQKPKVNSNKKKITDQKPIKSIKYKFLDQGIKKTISKSNIINKIPTI
jgi:hypothetical protein